MRYRIGFKGRWDGPISHALADLDPAFDDTIGQTVIVARDQAEFVTVVNRTAELGLTVVDVEAISDAGSRREQ